MKGRYLLTYLFVAIASTTVSGADLGDVLAHPARYNGQKLDLVGIARVPGYFYLFADISAAAKTDLSKALLVRKNSLAGISYRELDRQWVHVTGTMSSEPQRGWSPGSGLLLDRAELLRDRTPPKIEDWNVLGVFQNTTSESLAVDLVPQSDGGRTTFFLGPYETDKTIIDKGQVIASRLKGAPNVPLDERDVVARIASCEITFRHLSPEYQYSPESSDERTFYFRIFDNRIEQIPASEAKDWKFNWRIGVASSLYTNN